ncbi:MAG: hypothetical protein U1F58_16795 [Burkholderiales bacterium]
MTPDPFGWVLPVVLLGVVGAGDLLARFGGPPLVVAGGLTIGATALAMPFLLWRSAFRPVIGIALALTLVGAVLAALPLLHTSSPALSRFFFPSDSMGLGKLFVLFAGIDLLVWGGTTAALAAAASRAARRGSPQTRLLKLLAALPSLFFAIIVAVAVTKT